MSGFRLVDRNWVAEFQGAMRVTRRCVRIVCPFITEKAAEDLVQWNPDVDLQVITRFSLEDWSRGVSSSEALSLLLRRGANIRGVKDLHAKLFVFDDSIAILGSTNLTRAALNTNHELGVVMSERQSVNRCARYFGEIWREAGSTLSSARLEKYQSEFLELVRSGGVPAVRPKFPDYGTKVARVSVANIDRSDRVSSEGAFIKFFGDSKHRYTSEQTIESEVLRSGCHWACGYSRRPRNVKHGSVVFMARLMTNDTKIFGRAIAVPHRPGRDDATAQDIKRRTWKREWPYHVRVLRPELLGGTFENAVSLFELMDDLGADTFLTTQRNKMRGSGNLDPRSSLKRQPSMMLSELAYQVLSSRLQAAFERHGKLGVSTIKGLDWPKHVERLTQDGRQLLNLLLERITSESISIEQPETYPRYKEIVRAFGLVPEEGRNIVRQVRGQCGLDSLDEWTRSYGLPAISGLVVTDKNGIIAPGEKYFALHVKSRASDIQWWRDEVRQAAEYPWSRVLE